MGETEAETRRAEVGKWEMGWEVPAGGRAGEGTTGEGSGGDGPLMLKGKRMAGKKQVCVSARFVFQQEAFRFIRKFLEQELGAKDGMRKSMVLLQPRCWLPP